ncbi:MAG: hypothetical protein NUW37_13460 [Planctomycetes bacterium]|nr:hypothetical protein [Planctomycetota bacterium]
MNQRTIWLFILFVAIFAGGFAVGILYHRHFAFPHFDAHGDPDPAAHFALYFRDRLELTDAQTAKIESVLDRVHDEMMVSANEFHKSFEAVRAGAFAEIRETLTEEQIPEFEKLVEEMENAHADMLERHLEALRSLHPGD